MAVTTTQPLAGRREWTALAVLLLPLLLVSMDVSVLYFAVPFIAADLEPGATEQLWILDVYGFVLAGLLLSMGAVGDRIGRRRLLLVGAAGFGFASVGAAFAGSAGALIAARALLGVAGATLMPSTLALVRTMFPEERQRAKAIATWTAVMSGGVALGPVLSGVLLEHFWWGSVFLINLPAMALLLVLGPILLPEHRAPAAGRFDLAGAVLSLAAILPVVYAVKEWAATGFETLDAVLLTAGAGFGAMFVRRQRTAPHPMLDLALFRRPGYGSGVARNVVAMFALVGNAVFITQYLQSVLGLSPLVAALWSVAPSVLVGAAAPVATTLGVRHGRSAVMASGFALAAAGFGVLACAPASAGLAWSLAVGLSGASLLAIGVVAVLTLVTEAALGAIDTGHAGAATAVLETGSELGGALGIAVLGSIGAAVYRDRIGDLLPPGAGPAARDSLAGAVGSAPGEAVLAAARQAFTSGMHAAAIVGAAILLVTAAATLTSSRRRL